MSRVQHAVVDRYASNRFVLLARETAATQARIDDRLAAALCGFNLSALAAVSCHPSLPLPAIERICRGAGRCTSSALKGKTFRMLAQTTYSNPLRARRRFAVREEVTKSAEPRKIRGIFAFRRGVLGREEGEEETNRDGGLLFIFAGIVRRPDGRCRNPCSSPKTARSRFRLTYLRLSVLFLVRKAGLEPASLLGASS